MASLIFLFHYVKNYYWHNKLHSHFLILSSYLGVMMDIKPESWFNCERREAERPSWIDLWNLFNAQQYTWDPPKCRILSSPVISWSPWIFLLELCPHIQKCIQGNRTASNRSAVPAPHPAVQWCSEHIRLRPHAQCNNTYNQSREATGTHQIHSLTFYANKMKSLQV